MNMTNAAENKRIVLAGLKRRADRLDLFENDMISAVHQNCTDAKEQREKEAILKAAKAVTDEQRKERAQARLEAMQKAQKQERDVSRAMNTYMVIVIGLMLLSAATDFPYWTSITTALGLAVILAARLYRIYVPLESETAR